MTSGTLKQYIHKARRVKRKVVKKWCRQILDGYATLWLEPLTSLSPS